MKPRTVALLALLALLASGVVAAPLPAQERDLPAALRDAAVRRALERVDARTQETARALVEIGGIVSPSGQERERAEAVARRMREIGLERVEVDGTPNAVGVIPGRSGRALVFVSTLDDLATVAENQRAAPGGPRIEGDRVVGPGTNTSSTTVAMLAAAEAILHAGLRPEHDLVFAAVAQEETGLVGMRRLYEQHRERAVAFVDILGDGRSISYGALGIHWWRVVAHGPPGHSLGGGLPNVNQGIGRAVDRILQLPQPAREAEQRTIVNVAMLNSGSVYNHKPATGWFSLDIRSLSAPVIEEIERDVRATLAEVTRETEIRFEMEPFQLTPGGQIPGARESALVRTSAAIAAHLGLGEAALSNAGSANLNIAIAGGTPAIGLGGERGGARGQPTEWADVPAMMRSARHVVLLAATRGGARGR
jgi:acetylornithine deacetylase/succinyl-diaminopimelate desuccinylase-like protein